MWGLQTGYKAVGGTFVESAHESLISLLGELSGQRFDASVSSGKVESWLQERITQAREKHFSRVLEPVQVLWTGEVPAFKIRLPEPALSKPIEFTIALEGGESLGGSELKPRIIRRSVYNATTFVHVSVPLARELPVGYHELSVRYEGGEAKGKLFSAPKKTTAFTKTLPAKQWGMFAPLYGMKSQTDWGIGDLTEMARAQKEIHERGGGFFGTLPLLSSSGEGTEYDPSPYSPVSRLFWNEIFLDVESLVRKTKSPAAEALINKKSFQESLAKVRETKFVDYPAVFSLKKQVLKILSIEFFENGGADTAAFRDFLKRAPLVKTYAEFRSTDTQERDYHIYVQYEMDQNLKLLSDKTKEGSAAGLYLDFPVGVSRAGFDASHFRSSFLNGASAGAPPDAFFSGGQSWGFSPLHPTRLRDEGYTYFIQCVRLHMQYAKILRLDHIMGLHRIYAIPDGMDPKSGTYIRYRENEFFALLLIEAERAGVRIVGENLGTVPEAIDAALANHDCLGMWVLPFEGGDHPAVAIKKAPRRSLACLNTHDMVPFKGHLEVLDLKWFEDLKVLDPKLGAELRVDRKRQVKSWIKDLGIKDEHEIFKKLLELMAVSEPELLLVNIEDLWDETEPQNIPGTWKEYPNWRKKIQLPFESWSTNKEIKSFLETITKLRAQPSAHAQGKV